MTKPREFINQINTSQTVLGLDFGDKTIGIAISDKSKTIASPIKTLKRVSIIKDIDKLMELITEYEVGGVVIGLPLSLSGDENERTKKVRNFATNLNKKIKTIFYDERFSTDVVFKELRKNYIPTSKIKKKIDHLAASYILQGFLDNAKMNIMK